MKKTFLFFVLGWLLSIQNSIADPIITFFFHPYPPEQMAPYVVAKFKKPNSIAKQMLEGVLHHNHVAGIFSSYFGFLNVSNENGQTMFPRKQSKPVIQLVITNKITPIIMFQYTVSHWELVPGNPATLYRCEQKEDAETGLTFWDVQKIPPPENNYISPQDSLIILAKPHNIFVPTGIILAKESANLILPDMYIKKGIQTNRNALYMLNLSFLFRPVDLLYKKAKTNYETLVAE